MSTPQEPSIIQHDRQINKRKLQKQSRIEVEDADIEAMFDKVKRRKKKNPQDIGLLVEKVMALLEVAAEGDIELNRQNKPTIKKIQTLPLLTDFLSKKHLQPEFLDHGVLSLFKIWLEPLPDGSLPNTTVQASLLNISTHTFPTDIRWEYRREQLKKSGLGKVIMFLLKSEEEISHCQHKTCKGFDPELESDHIRQGYEVFRPEKISRKIFNSQAIICIQSLAVLVL